jgi:hypothetical protein
MDLNINKVSNASNNKIFYYLMFVLLTLVMLGVYFFLASYKSDLGDSRKRINNDLAITQSKLIEMKKKQKEFSSAIVVWNKIKNHDDNDYTGLKIDAGINILNNLVDKYLVSDFSSDISAPVTEIKDAYRAGSKEVMASNVILNFGALSDEYALSFIDSLNELPGYVSLKYLKISKNSPITSEGLEQLLQRDTLDIPSFLSTRVEFVWRDLKNIIEEDSSKQDS